MKRHTVIWQYITFYFIISAIPIFAILFYFYPMAKNVIIDKAKESNWNVTRNIANTMNAQISGIFNMVREIKLDNKLTPYAVQKNNYAEIEAVRELKKIVASSSIVYDVLYFVEENQTFYTKSTLIRLKSYDAGYSIYKYQNRDMRELANEMVKIKDVTVLPAEPVSVSNSGIRNMITFVFPMGGFEKKGERTAIFVLVEENSLTKLIDIYSGEYEDNILVFDFNNRLITRSNYKNEFSMDELKKIENWNDQKKTVVMDLKEGEFIVSKVKSETNNWSYVSYIKMEELTEELNQLRNQMVGAVMILLCVELLLILFFSNQNYKPIKKVLTLFKNTDVPDDDGDKMNAVNEFQQLEYVFGNLSQVKDELTDKIKQAYPALRNDILKKLLNGELLACNQDTINHMGKDIGVYFPYASFSVAILSCEFTRWNDQIDIAEYLEQMTFEKEIKIYAISDTRKNRKVLLSNQENEDDLLKCLERLQIQIGDQLGARIRVVVSSCAYNIRDYSLLYAQALSMSEFAYIQKDNDFVKADDYQLNNYHFKNYPVDLINQLEVSVVRREESNIIRITKELEAYLEDLSLPIYFMRILYRNIISCLIKGLLSLDDEENEEELEWNRYLFDLNYNPDVLIGHIRACCEKLCDRIKEHHGEEKETFEEILSYIDDNYLAYDFSIQKVAERFHSKISNFSQYFKKRSGLTFKQYVDCVKADKAKQLLADTDESLESISEILGYSNASSFIRAFKRVANMTPGEYREETRKNSL